FLTAALSFKKGFSTRTLSEFGREPLLLVLKFQLNAGHPPTAWVFGIPPIVLSLSVLDRGTDFQTCVINVLLAIDELALLRLRQTF
ncbi:MAG TPA: hypothetical protein VMH20_16205, partial [Verrucomicrobiae bacterium]|nr:hypothetical protein [Verrucomicrobiae bacterium]